MKIRFGQLAIKVEIYREDRASDAERAVNVLLGAVSEPTWRLEIDEDEKRIIIIPRL